jgi:hypothetical protein
MIADVTVEAVVGSHISNVFQKAKEIAICNVHEVNVSVKFNGVIMKVDTNTTPEEFLDDYNKKLYGA